MLPTATINATDVRDVLRQLSFDSVPSRTPLSDLSVVHRSLVRNGFRPSHDARQIEISRILSEVTEKELSFLRASCGARGESDLEQIRLDFSVGHRDLEAWSAIYHIYLRTDLNLYLKDFEQILGDRHRRTIQRRLKRGVSLLTARLQAMERRSVERERRERLSKALPSGSDRPLFHTETSLTLVCRALQSHQSTVTAVCGPMGIGKTAVARAVAWHLASRSEIDDVVWVSGEQLTQQPSLVAEGVVQEPSSDSAPLRAMLDTPKRSFHRRCLVVVDGVDNRHTADACMAAVTSLPRMPLVLFTGRVRFTWHTAVHAIEMGPLPQHSALDLLRHEIRAQGINDAMLLGKANLLPVVAASAGNPEALCLAARQLSVLDVHHVADGLIHAHGEAACLYERMWGAAFQCGSHMVRDVVRAVLEIRRAGHDANPESIRRYTGYGGSALADALYQATELWLLEPLGPAQNRHFALGLLLDRYLQQVAANDGTRSCISRPKRFRDTSGAVLAPHRRAI